MIKKLNAILFIAASFSIAMGSTPASASVGRNRSIVIRVFYKGGIKESFWLHERHYETPILFTHNKTYFKEVKAETATDGKTTHRATPGSVNTGVNGMLVREPNGEEKILLHVSYLVRIKRSRTQGAVAYTPVVRTLVANGVLYRHRFQSQSGGLAVLVATISR